MNLTKNSFVKAVFVLLSGTVIAQLLNVAFTPIITRLYNPEELGTLGFYLQIAGFLAALVTLRLELSFPMEKFVPHRALIFQFVLKWTVNLCVIICIPVLLALIFFEFSLSNTIILALIPAGVLLHALFNLGTHWQLGDEQFRRISMAKLTQSISTNGLKVVFGLLSFGRIGLIVSVLLGLIGSNLIYLKGILKPFKSIRAADKTNKTGVLLARHKDLYRFNLPHILVDLFRDLLLASFMLYVFSEYEYGLYYHSFKMLKLPLILVGAAVGQVLFTSCAKRIDDGISLWPIISKVIMSLAGISVVPFLLLFFYGTEIFSFVFGEEWGGSGQVSEIITWWLFLNFVVSPLSYLPILLNKQKAFFLVNIASTLVLLAALFIPYILEARIKFDTLLMYITLAQVLINGVLIMYFVKIVKQHDQELDPK